ncbi:hypothetical protein HYH02_008118 [Chlamydomonas schloesseri]|uniref:Response regulatory domain-containing protein n=1 Tax=Chlamydomonas schloesseri TaxID=2026947 RepID=A0A836B4E7_9CHLO|nr:hypothetical protein HYH02_008118 [Chlamydomonas schloesseri]|eukprot:KAG2446964.1 hypothetical protein HYH02_008118 [Chlamydomonas schloesseri]
MGKPLHFDVHGRLRILAIDDDSVNLMVIESVLKPMGWDIVPAIDGSEAYAACDNEPEWPDIVLLDYNLEVGDSGETVLANLRSRFAGFNVPIVMCTAMSANSVELERCLKNGAADILLKPYERSRVMDIVEKHCPGKAAPAAKPAAAPPPPPAPAPTAAPAPAPAAAPAAPAPAASDVESFCVSIGLDYLGKKLKEQGVSLSDLKAIDDGALRKMGVVVKSQRDKILEAAKSL